MRVVYGSDRYTVDLDMSVDKLDLEKLKSIVEKAVLEDFEDGFIFEVKSWRSITEQKEYPGLRLTLDFLFQKTRIQAMQLDFTVSEMKDSFIKKSIQLSLEVEKVVCNVYSTEQIIVEKLEALVSRGSRSTRSKDLFDINHLFSHKINEKRLGERINAVFSTRGTPLPDSFEKYFSALDTNFLKTSWLKLGKLIPNRPSFEKLLEDFILTTQKIDVLVSKK